MEQPNIAQAYPYVKETEPGKYAWCACGRSSNQPFCDGTHRGSLFRPVVVDIAEKRSIAWCGCKHTKNPPFCDGSHNKL